jgi:hypothetical protein
MVIRWINIYIIRGRATLVHTHMIMWGITKETVRGQSSWYYGSRNGSSTYIVMWRGEFSCVCVVLVVGRRNIVNILLVIIVATVFGFDDRL